jgi:hypothetical protein
MNDTFDKIASNFIATLSKEELDYCTDDIEKYPDHFGFAGLQDLMDANVELLNTIEKLNLKVPTNRPHLCDEEACEYLNKCIDRIDEKLKEIAKA